MRLIDDPHIAEGVKELHDHPKTFVLEHRNLCARGGELVAQGGNLSDPHPDGRKGYPFPPASPRRTPLGSAKRATQWPSPALVLGTSTVPPKASTRRRPASMSMRLGYQYA